MAHCCSITLVLAGLTSCSGGAPQPADPCLPDPCTDSPAPDCAGTLARTWASGLGACVADPGPGGFACLYAVATQSDCAAFGASCAGGACLCPPGTSGPACADCATGYHRGGGACVDACTDPNPCTTPPPASCLGELRVTYPAAGTCSLAALQPVCGYEATSQDCAASGLACWPTGCVLGTPGASAQLAAIRGDLGPTTRPVAGALVTFVHGVVGDEPAGFYLQAEQAGPALFVALDPATASPPLAVGDRVDFTATEVALVDGRVRVVALSGLASRASGLDVAPLLQELDPSTGLEAAAPSLADELVSARVTVIGAPLAAGPAMAQAAVATPGMPAGAPGLAVRLPAALAAAVDLQPGCAFTLPGSPFDAPVTGGAHFTAWSAADLAGLTCPAPRVVSATATGLRSVVVTFDRTLAPSSVDPAGTQFTVTGGVGLAVAAASVSGAQVLLDTARQIPATSYTVTVAGSVTDTLASPVDAAAASADFTSTPYASLRIDEVNANQLNGLDLVELLAETSGPVDRVALQLYGIVDALVLGTLPAITVAAGDRIVVHVLAGAAFTTETSGSASCIHPSCFAGAWDVAGPFFTTPPGGIPYIYTFFGDPTVRTTARVLVLETRAGATLDAVPFALAGATPAPNFYTELARVQALGLWQPATCGGDACSETSTPSGIEASADWGGLSTTVAGSSAQRRSGTSGRTRADWTIAPSTWGAPNAP